MKKAIRWIAAVAVAGMVGWMAVAAAVAQEKPAPAAAPAAAAPAAAAPAAAAPAPAGGAEAAKPAEGAAAGGAAKAERPEGGPGLIQVISSSGTIGLWIWFGLFANLFALTYFIAECGVVLRAKRIIPQTLVQKVEESLGQGDVLKALQNCKDEPGPLANILSSGFHNVEEGFETIQDVVRTAADMESEKLLQRVTYLNVISNLGPLLGLLGTVHGMIYAFSTLATMAAGAAQQAMLAINIAESLYCTAAGLLTAIPSLAAFYFFRNKANRIILGMEALTLDAIKSLRNVEVVTE